MVRVDISRRSPFSVTARVVHRPCHGPARQPQEKRKAASHSVLSPVEIDRHAAGGTAVVHEKPSPRRKKLHRKISRAYYFVDQATILRVPPRVVAIRATNGLFRVAQSTNERQRRAPGRPSCVIDAAVRTSRCAFAWRRNRPVSRRSPGDANRRGTATMDRLPHAGRCARENRQASG